MNDAELKKLIQQRYAKTAETRSSCCGPASSSGQTPDLTCSVSNEIGYTDEELTVVPDGANLGLGCGNPVALATLRNGETVLDLGSGAGLDCFLAANMVGPAGKVIGVDMTPEMIARATENARKTKYRNVEFRLGEIENLPIADESVDVIISNCVINLSPDKGKVFQEAYRVLKPGGRLMVSDIVLLKELPLFVKESVEAYIGCVAGAMPKDAYIGAMRAAGFHEISILHEKSFPLELITTDVTVKNFVEMLDTPVEEIEATARSVMSMTIAARKQSNEAG